MEPHEHSTNLRRVAPIFHPSNDINGALLVARYGPKVL
jgi:hypothetical protein